LALHERPGSRRINLGIQVSLTGLSEEVRMGLPASSLALLLLFVPAAHSVAADDLDDAYQCLKEAQTKNDAAKVRTLAVELHRIAQRIIAARPPDGDAENDSWTSRVANARSADLFSEYALYEMAMKATPATLVDLISTLEQHNPKSRYLDPAYGPYLVAISRTSTPAKAAAIAEKALANFPDNEDLLLVALETAMTRKQNDRALSHANRLIAVMTRHPNPEAVPAADWNRKRSLALAHGHWSAGIIHSEKGQYVAADKNLRAALPLIKGNDAMLGPALFHLGMVNYQIGKMTLNKARVLEGARFSEQSAAIDSPYADQARHNALVMKNEGQRMR
jgi:hypothetical protein